MERILPQGDTDLLQHPIAQGLLASTIPARVAFIASDGTPRVVPTWFQWTGSEIVTPTFVAAPHIHRPAARIRALKQRPAVCITIDTEQFPPRALTLAATSPSPRSTESPTSTRKLLAATSAMVPSSTWRASSRPTR